VILNLERKEISKTVEIRRAKNHHLETKFQWPLDNNTIIIPVCTTIQLMKTVMKIIGKKIRAG